MIVDDCKAMNPLCLQNIARLPCIYQNTNVLATCYVFGLFLHYPDGRLGLQAQKGALFLEDCSAHPKDTSFQHDLGVIFLPTT